MAVNPLFIWAVLLLIIKLSKTHQKAERHTKDDFLPVTAREQEANQCSAHQNSIRGALSQHGFDRKTGETNNSHM